MSSTSLGFLTQPKYSSSESFNLASQQRPRIPIKFTGPSGMTASVTTLMDTGNDITLMTKENARRLGIDPERDGVPFNVLGVSAGTIRPRLVRMVGQIGNLRPRVFRVGVGDVPENLTGYEDMSQYYNIAFKGRESVTISERDTKSSNMGRLSSQACRFLGSCPL